MKKVLVSALFLISNVAFSQSYPSYSSYAPTYKDVVVLYDVEDREFVPYFFHYIMGELLDMSAHKSCNKVQVVKTGQDLSVVCNSIDRNQVVIGTLEDSKQQKGLYRLYNINWNNRAELVQNVNPKDQSLYYSVVVK